MARRRRRDRLEFWIDSHWLSIRIAPVLYFLHGSCTGSAIGNYASGDRSDDIARNAPQASDGTDFLASEEYE